MRFAQDSDSIASRPSVFFRTQKATMPCPRTFTQISPIEMSYKLDVYTTMDENEEHIRQNGNLWYLTGFFYCYEHGNEINKDSFSENFRLIEMGDRGIGLSPDITYNRI